MIGKKGYTALVIVVIAFAYNRHRNTREPSPVIDTPLGKLQGIISYSREGRALYEFLGIPFAEPPVGRLRFEPPQPAKPWVGIRDASMYGSECAQLRLITGEYGGNEDCLYLNVFTPKKRNGKLLPVMVFFHGGAFVTGSANTYRPKYFMDEDIVLVTINYRLAALGFLNTGDEIVRGNMGLKDQTMALHFVQNNIRAFGGDPKQVLIFGESAGSASVSFHLVSPLSKDLYSKAIMQSGTFASQWAVFKEPAKQASRFAEKFGCKNDTTKEMVACLKSIDTRTFVDGHQEVLVSLREQITLFVPTIETVHDQGTFLPDDPLKLMQAGKVHNVPVLAGVNSDEGLLTSAIITENQTKLEQANADFPFWSARLLYYAENRPDIAEKIRRFYFGNVPNLESSNVQNFTNMFSDRLFFGPLSKFTKEYRKHASIWLYYYSHKGEFSLARILRASQRPYFKPAINIMIELIKRYLMEDILGMHLAHPGVCHADELPLFYDWLLGPEIRESSRDYKISRNLVRLWTSFARNHKSLSFDGVTLVPVLESDKSLKYININSNPQVIQEPFEDRLQFWESLGV